ncbi:MAG: peptidoglycan-binding domain-containing protein, partial [Paracoccaceae bacterium]
YLTALFILGIQHGLSAWVFFDDGLTGSLDTETRRAIKAFQLEQGILSDWPSWETARMLGLEPL